jgi:uncharacterized membrane protein/uncharacterized membrane protein YbhN (UPF0104 family)
VIKSRTYQILSFFIGWPLSLLALFFVVKLIFDKSSSFTNFSINPPLVLYAFVCFLLYYIFRTVVWKKLLEFSGHPLSFKETAYLWSSSEIKRYLPGNIWALLGRTVSFGDKNIATSTIAKALVYEAELVILSCLLISLFCVWHLFNSFLPEVSNKELIIWTINLIVVLGCLFYIANSYVIKSFPQKIQGLIRYLLPQYDVKQNGFLLLLMTISMFFFGLGSYFCIIAFVYIPYEELLTVVGIMSLSLLVGYLSIITPMGLGVREAAASMMLSRLVESKMTGVTVLFARVLLIATDIVYFLFCTLWFYTKNTVVVRIEKVISQHKHEALLVICTLIYITYFTHITFLRHDNFYSGKFDLGNMDQTVWNTLHGRIFEFTNPDGTNLISRLAFHADFILVLLAPFYAIWQDPKMLLLIQTVVIASGGIFVYALARHILKNQTLALVFAILYLINPSVSYANLYDFHPVTLATTFLLASWYFLLKKRYVVMLVFLVLAGLTKEQIWAIVGLFGLWMCVKEFFLKKKNFSKKHLAFGLVLFVVSASLFYFLISSAIPTARGANHFALEYYAEFGDSPASIIKNVVFSPTKVVSILLSADRLDYLQQLLLPVGFLPLFNPFSLIFAVPDLLINMLSNNMQLRQIYFQYTATVTPFLFISAIYGYAFVQHKWKRNQKYILTVFIGLSLLGTYLYGALPLTKNANLDMVKKPVAQREIIEEYLKTIPQDARVAATNNLGAHLTHRQYLYTIPLGVNDADVVVFLLNDQSAQPSLEAQKDMAQQLQIDPRFKQVFSLNDFVVFEKQQNQANQNASF